MKALPVVNSFKYSSKNAHFQNEVKFTTFFVEMSFICMRMKNHLCIKDWALNLILIHSEMAYCPLMH